ncbi:hypothetical protein CABS01_12224 [Colletotrichum abscissum]|uniref:uncharacterized protein n=1 Tax=Colletotrichum abscissum TaxID=1671311 RepID=UPI0027D5CED7|nr:uncharacterized protein CABS01_12224 [Colletotrichum abscissum]KAK1491131.1 hypothetical protein CABS01_12224 [Colletotrichum abscissum]
MQKYQSRNVLGLAIFLVPCSACIGKKKKTRGCFNAIANLRHADSIASPCTHSNPASHHHPHDSSTQLSFTDDNM